MITYGKQTIDESDIRAVTDTLKSDFLTTGPKVREFEEKFADYVGVLFIAIPSVLFVLGTILNHSKVARLTYSFFDDKLTIQNKESKSIFYQNIENLTVKQNLADKVFDTATITLTPEFSIKFINNYSQLYNWIKQLVERSRQMRSV